VPCSSLLVVKKARRDEASTTKASHLGNREFQYALIANAFYLPLHLLPDAESGLEKESAPRVTAPRKV
jgi:hypothetical protein